MNLQNKLKGKRSKRINRLYKNDQLGIYKRYLRELDNWNIHLQNCKNFILNQVAELNPEKIAFLGSGWLLDVPVSQLLAQNKVMHFYDIVHPKQIQHKYRNDKRVRFVQKDLTGVLDILNQQNTPNLTADFFQNNVVKLNEKYDILVSLNIMNQLDGLLYESLSKIKVPAVKLNFDFRKTIQSNHLQLLAQNNAILITDYQELLVNAKNEVVKHTDLIYVDVPENEKTKHWSWIFDTHKTYRSKFNTIFKVKALKL